MPSIEKNFTYAKIELSQIDKFFEGIMEVHSQTNLRIAVCDDSPVFLNETSSYIEAWSASTGHAVQIFSYDNGDALIEAHKTCHMDIIFLDIIMPLLNGMDTARELRQQDRSVHIIFLTSSPEFALESYEVKAQGYLLKPVSQEKITKELNEIAIQFYEEPKHLILKTNFGYQKQYFHDIEYVEAQNKRVLFHLCSGQTLEVSEPLNHFEQVLLNTDGFFKCHRSYLVYLPNVDHFSNTEITTRSGQTIPIARGFGKAFKEAYFSVMFAE